MIRSTLLALFVLLTFPLFAAGFTVTPSSGPTTGGTEVTIKGDFGNWPFPVRFDVFFHSREHGYTRAKSTVRVDAQTLVAITPRHFPGTTQVLVADIVHGSAGIDTGQTFSFVGAPLQGYERLLVPLFTPPLRGAFGSEFHTELRVHNASNDYISVTGLEGLCILSACPIPNPDAVLSIDISPGHTFGNFDNIGTPGRLIYILPEDAPFLSFNLRVHDVSRAGSNFGTEIPVVREREMTTNPMVFLAIPTDSRFRKTLRIYGTGQTSVTVKFSDEVETIQHLITLQPGALFEPAYGAISDFPAFANGKSEMTVRVDPPPFSETNPVAAVPVWAFVSVTNNETQVITTITPQR